MRYWTYAAAAGMLVPGVAQAQHHGEFAPVIGVMEADGQSQMQARGWQQGPGGTWYNPRQRRCTRMAVVSGRVESIRIEPVMVCRHDSAPPPMPVAVPYHAGEVPVDYDMVCSSNPRDLGEYAWDVDRDRYVHAGRVEFSPGEMGRTLMIQVSGPHARVLLPARLGGGGWAMLDGAAVSPAGVRARLASGASLSLAAASGQVSVRTRRKVLYAGRCAMITAVGTRGW
ncbi:MAG: hypothetical protein KGM17_04770 [Sphingomonadales bacterium]|nr:hypothetical protein [Sphingomonadales bacterium]